MISGEDATVCNSPQARRIPVSTAAELTAALQAAAPRDAIVLADGNYQGNFVAQAVGLEAMPIGLCGTGNAVLQGPSLTTGYTLYLQNAQYWQVVGLSVVGGAKGIMLDGANHNLLKNLTVSDIGSEGIHLRKNSSDNVIEGAMVTRTGLAGNPMYGEGIYIGSSQNNWCTLTAGNADRSDRNRVQGCHVSQTTAEGIDIKEGTTGGEIRNNTLDGAGINASAATSLINVKGNSYLLTGNTFSHAPTDAISIHVLMPGWGACNRATLNTEADALPGYGVHLAAPKPWPALEVSNDNIFGLAQSGLTNAQLNQAVSKDAACISTVQSVTCTN